MRSNLHINILLAVLLGIIAGVFIPNFSNIYLILGKVFISLLKYIVVPLVFASLITGIISLGNIGSLQKMGLKTILYFIATTAISSVIGLILSILFKPGKGFNYNISSTENVKEAVSLKEMFSQIIPTDFFTFISGGNMLFVIIISLILGVVVLAFGKNINFPIDELFEGFNDFMMIITNWVIIISPIGIFGLIAQLVITTGASSILFLLKYALVILLGLSIHAFIVLPLILRLFIKVSPVSIAKDVFASLATGFTTASSAASLPILMDDVRKKLKVPNKVASFVLPLGITINMDGTALFQAVAAVFISQIYGVELSVFNYGVIIFFTILSSIGAAAVPSAGIITLTMILTAIGVPIGATAIILSIDRILDMNRTTVNLWGNTIATLVITKLQGEKAFDDK